jgi:hypothetical protein
MMASATGWLASLGQIKQAGELGPFRTPRHIIRAIVDLVIGKRACRRVPVPPGGALADPSRNVGFAA